MNVVWWSIGSLVAFMAALSFIWLPSFLKKNGGLKATLRKVWPWVKKDLKGNITLKVVKWMWNKITSQSTKLRNGVKGLKIRTKSCFKRVRAIPTKWIIIGIAIVIVICLILLLCFDIISLPSFSSWSWSAPSWVLWTLGSLFSVLIPIGLIITILHFLDPNKNPKEKIDTGPTKTKWEQFLGYLRPQLGWVGTLFSVLFVFVIFNAIFWYFWPVNFWTAVYQRPFLVTQLIALALMSWRVSASKKYKGIVPIGKTSVLIVLVIFLALMFSYVGPGEIFEQKVAKASENTEAKIPPPPQKWVLYCDDYEPIEIRNLQIDDFAGTISYEIWSKYASQGKIGEANGTRKPGSTSYFGTYKRRYPESKGDIWLSPVPGHPYHYIGQERDDGEEWSDFEIRPWS